MSNIAELDAVARPETTSDEYWSMMEKLAITLADRLHESRNGSPGDLHLVASAADFEIILIPIQDRLRTLGWRTRATCVWPVYRVHNSEFLIDSAPIKAMVSEKIEQLAIAELAIVAQVVGTITELESIAAQILYDVTDGQSYSGVNVLAPITHFEAKDEFRLAIPEPFSQSLNWIDLRRDYELRNDGRLVPGIGATNLERVGLVSKDEFLSHVPAMFERRFDYKKRPKPGSELTHGI